MTDPFVLLDPDAEPSDANANVIAEGTVKTIHVKFTTDETVFRITDIEMEIGGVDYKIDVSPHMSEGDGDRCTAVRCIATHIKTGERAMALAKIFGDFKADEAMINLAANEAVMHVREMMDKRFG